MEYDKLHDIAIQFGKTLIKKDSDLKKWVEDMLPELKESEDEKIRKGLIALIKECLTPPTLFRFGLNKEDTVAWLKKQGEQKPNKCMYSKDNYTDEDRKVLCDSCEEDCELKQNPSWSEEDERMYNLIHDLTWEGYKTNRQLDIPTFGIINDWFKSLKDRVLPQPKLTWSKEDDENMKEIILFCDTIASGAMYSISGERLKSISQTLKSLRPQNTWKPSEEQIKCLSGEIAYKERWKSPYSLNILKQLLGDLKKLREE